MFDTTRIFVCENIAGLINDNKCLADDIRLECFNTIGPYFYENMDDLDKAERIVINDCRCVYFLSDRPPLKTWPDYDKLSKEYNVDKNLLKIKHFIHFDKYVPLKRTKEILKMIEWVNSKKAKNKR